jgi:hypothetical protein
MDSNSPAEDLPTLYRAILDRVALLEAAGERAEAGRIRTQATTTYSRAWDSRARRELEGLLRRAERPTAAESRLGRGGARRVGRAGRRQTPAARTAEG